jgi:anti-anti-sigma factor
MSGEQSSDDRAQEQLTEATVENEVLVIKVLAPEIRSPEVSHALRDELIACAKRTGKSRVVVDLKNVRFIGSVGLLGFLSLRRLVDVDERGEVVVCHVSENLEAMFRVCRLVPKSPGQPSAVQIEPTREAAIARLRSV